MKKTGWKAGALSLVFLLFFTLIPLPAGADAVGPSDFYVQITVRKTNDVGGYIEDTEWDAEGVVDAYGIRRGINGWIFSNTFKQAEEIWAPGTEVVIQNFSLPAGYEIVPSVGTVTTATGSKLHNVNEGWEELALGVYSYTFTQADFNHIYRAVTTGSEEPVEVFLDVYIQEGNGAGTGVTKPDTPASTSPFRDVKTSDYFYGPVLWAVEKKIAAGITPDEFRPGDSCTRAQAMAFLWRAAGSPSPERGVNPFQDVKDSDYYRNAVLWAWEKGIAAGVTSTQFSPESPVTRAQVVSFLWRATGSPTVSGSANAFRDVSPSAYYAPAVHWAVREKITSGTGNNAFSPEQVCTRGQMMTFLYQWEN